jgi:hypothetical protein
MTTSGTNPGERIIDVRIDEKAWPDVDEDLSSAGLLRGAPAAANRSGAA